MDELNDVAVRIFHHGDTHSGPNLTQRENHSHSGGLAGFQNFSDVRGVDGQIPQSRGRWDSPRYGAMLRHLLIGDQFDQRITAAKSMHGATATHGHRDITFVDEAEYIPVKS